MRKDTTICFRTNEELRRALETVARDDRRSVSSTIELILAGYLKSRGFTSHDERERRRYPRKALVIPAHVTTRDSVRHGAVVLDLSLGGMCVSVPRDCVSKMYEGEEPARFEASFTLPGRKKPIRVVCKADRMVPSNGDVHVGASFADADFASYQTLQQFLV